MRVQDLIDILSECDPDKEVAIAAQPEHPLAFKVKGVYAPNEDTDPDDVIVWIVQGDHLDDPYSAPRESFQNYAL